jgi:hypothetical protein
LQSEVSESDYIVSKGRAEVANELPNWTIDQYYRALSTEIEKAEQAQKALQKTPLKNGRSN